MLREEASAARDGRLCGCCATLSPLRMKSETTSSVRVEPVFIRLLPRIATVGGLATSI
jgi:hypothetical protein